MILGILQARVSSTRLPGKVLLPILGKPMLRHQAERILKCKLLDKFILATSNDGQDDAILDICRDLQIPCYRGSLTDVLDRFYQAARGYAPDHVVRLTGDCPLIDPTIVDQLIATYLSEPTDYMSNCVEPTFPDGLDVEAFRFHCLEEAWREARQPSQREHVTLFINRQPERYRVRHFKGKIDLSHLRWTVDESSDFEFAKRVYEELYPTNIAFGMNDVLELLERCPELQTINANIARNEGLVRSVDQEPAVSFKSVESQ